MAKLAYLSKIACLYLTLCLSGATQSNCAEL